MLKHPLIELKLQACQLVTRAFAFPGLNLLGHFLKINRGKIFQVLAGISP